MSEVKSCVFDVVKKRRSIRKYRPSTLPKEVLLTLLESARLAPSAKNLQPWHFIVVLDQELKNKLVDACKGQKFIADASVIIVGLANTKISRWAIIDTTIALTQIMLVAHDLGLGTCWIGAFYEDKVKELLKIPEEWTVVGLLVVGYPDEEPPPRPRKSLDEIVSENYFGTKLMLS